MALGAAAQSALMQWINTFPLDYKVESAADLSDGFVLSKILAEIDSTYLRNVPAQTNTLQRVVKGLFRYIENECDGLDPLLDTPSLRMVAENGKTGSVFEILIVILMAAVNGPHRETFVINITKLSQDVQSEIAEIIKQKQQEIEATASAPHNGQSEQLGSDFELEFEARYIDLIGQKKILEQEKDRLKKLNADMATRLERLQDNNDHLQESLAAAEDKLQGVARDKDTADVIRSLEARLREQDELIANQEGQFEQDRIEKEIMRKEMGRLKSASDLVIQLQDEIKELHFQNAELTKKANTLDRYKQKLESQRDFQTDIKTLELDNEELQMRVKDYELLKHRNATLEATHTQFQNTLARHEMEIFELSSQKKALEEEKANLQRGIIRLEEVRAADEDHIAELQEQLVNRPQTITSSAGPSIGSLEAELEQSESGTRTSLEVTMLRAENQLLKSNATAAQDAAALRIQLEEEARIRKREEQKYNELYEKHVIASQQVTAILNASTAEGLVKGVNAAMLVGQLEMLTPEYYSSEAFANLRKSYLISTEKLAAAERTIQDLETELESSKRALLRATSDLNMIDQEDLDALEGFKAAQESLASSTEIELKKLQSRYNDLQLDYNQQKSQLIAVLLSKDKLQQMVADNLTKDHSKADESAETGQIKGNLEKALSDLKTSREVSHTLSDATSEVLAQEQALLGYAPSMKISLHPEAVPLPDSPILLNDDSIKQGSISPWQFWTKQPRPPSTNSISQLQNQDSIIYELNMRIKELESGGPDAQKTAPEQEYINLKRENNLIATAWYGLTLRLQMDSVGLQRRQDAPKSWMNKQRQAINAFGRR